MAAQACKSALVLATRHGVIVAYAFMLWSALHYFLGSFGLKKALADARAEQAADTATVNAAAQEYQEG